MTDFKVGDTVYVSPGIPDVGSSYHSPVLAALRGEFGTIKAGPDSRGCFSVSGPQGSYYCDPTYLTKAERQPAFQLIDPEEDVLKTSRSTMKYAVSQGRQVVLSVKTQEALLRALDSVPKPLPTKVGSVIRTRSGETYLKTNAEHFYWVSSTGDEINEFGMIDRLRHVTWEEL